MFFSKLIARVNVSRFHIWGAALGLLTLFFPLSACQGQSDITAVSFAVFGDSAEFAAYENLVAAFEEQHPDIDIQIQHTPGQSDYRQRLAASFSGGRPPDVMLLNYRRFATFAASGGLEPLGPYLTSSIFIQETDFFPVAVEAFRFENQLWCIPQNISSLVVYYNQDLFDAAGLPYPTDDWTWDDFLLVASALTLDTNGDGFIDQYGAGISPKLFRVAPFIWQNGGQLVDDPVAPTRLALDSPASLDALRWFVDLQVEAGVVPGALDEAAEASESRFLSGRMAMFFNSRRGVPTYRTITSFSWDITSLPKGVQSAGILHSDAYCMAAEAQNKETAWKFIEFANSFEGQMLIAASGRTVPSLIAVADSPAFLSPDRPPARSRVFIDTVPVLRTVPVMSTWAAIEETASKEIARAFYGDITVEEAVAAALNMTQSYFERAHQNELR